MTYYVQQKMFTLGDKFSVKDENENDCFFVKKELFSLNAHYEISDMNGKLLLEIDKKFFSLLPQFTIEKEGKDIATVVKEFAFFNKRFTIESVYGNFEISGDFMSMEYCLKKDENLIANIEKAWFTWGDSYKINTDNTIPAEFAIALVIIIDNILDNSGGANTGAVNG